jgi:transcription-repair coupling factor (superfamily II helicase)
MYRKLAGLSFLPEADALAAEFRDRFGPLPAPVKRLLALARLRLLAAGLGLKSVATDGDRLLLGKGRDEFLMVNGRHLRLHQHGADERLAEIEKRLRQLARAPGQEKRKGQ